ncbi:hypothetical protein OIY81_3618 [Cryptosporidium canis]|uniref:Uncharacterized protein n=1 Tax=Cryptosporidium canis TaxID=195482 RepID=A0ABQ8P3Y5_9CRYT|nr:hypothetical protein OJ252_3724 [Cryptosporidium canis]KAJ1604950.1 hypothetical protein OIY81_3618 [Cryptosporidium canis]
MNNNFVLGVNKNHDYLVDFVSYILNSRESSLPKLSLPILGSAGVPNLLLNEKLTQERHERNSEKFEFFNRYLKKAPSYSDICHQKTKFRSPKRYPERHNIESSHKNRSVPLSNIESNPIFNYYSKFSNRDITPLRERACLACKKSSLQRHNEQRKIKTSNSHDNISFDRRTYSNKEKISAINELYNHLIESKNANNLKNILNETKKLDQINKIKNNTKTIHYPKNTTRCNSKSPIKKTVHEICINIKNTSAFHELSSNYKEKNHQLIFNTDPIKFKSRSLLIPIERLSI